MNNSDGKIFFGIELDTTQLTADVERAKKQISQLGSVSQDSANTFEGAFKKASEQSAASLKVAVNDQKQLIREIKADLAALNNQSAGSTGKDKLAISGDIKGAKKALAEEQGTLLGLQKQQVIANKQEKESQGGLIGSLEKWAVGLFTVTAAMKVGKAIIASTEATANVFEQAIEASTSATGFFFKAIASGDWSNFLDGLKAAIKGATDYVDAMDIIENRKNEQLVRSSKFDIEIGKNRANSYSTDPKEVKKAITNIIALQTEKLTEESKLAKDEYNVKLKKIASDNGLTKLEVQDIATNYSSISNAIEKGEEYIKLKIEAANTSRFSDRGKEIIKKLKEIGAEGEAAAKINEKYSKVPMADRADIAKSLKIANEAEAAININNRRDKQRLVGLQKTEDDKAADDAKSAIDEKNKLTKSQLEYETEIGRQRIRNQIDIDQETLNLQKDGAEKSKQQAELDFNKAKVEIATNKADQLRKLNEVNGGIDKETGKQTSKYVSVLPQTDQDQIDAKLVLAEQTKTDKIIEINEKEGERLKAIWNEINDTRLTGIEKQREVINDKFDKMAKEAIGNAELLKAIDIERNRANDKILQDWLDQYKDYAKKRIDVEKIYTTGVAEANVNYKGDELKMALEGLDKNRKSALKAINSDEAESVIKSSELFLQLFSDTSTKSIAEIRKIAAEAKTLFDFLNNTDAKSVTGQTIGGKSYSKEELISIQSDPQKMADIKAQFEALIQTANDGDIAFGGFGNSIKMIFEGFGKGKKSLGDIKKGVEGLQGAFQGLSFFAGQATDLLNAISKEEGDAASSAAKSIGAVMDIAGATLQGFAQGGIVGAAVAFAMSVATKIFQAAKAHNEALKKLQAEKTAQQKEYNDLLLKQNELLEKAVTIFGTDTYGQAMGYANVADKTRNASTNANAGLSGATVQTGSSKTGLFGWGGERAEYSSLLKTYPLLIDGQGKLNKELAQSILDNQSLDDASKKALESALQYAGEYEDALASMDDYLKSVFGTLGSDMMTAIVDNLGKSQDALDEFGKSAAKTIGKLLQDIAFSLFLADDFERLSKTTKAIMDDVTLTPEQKAASTAKAMDDFSASVGIDSTKANDWLTQWKQKNPDYFPDANAQTRTATSKGLESISQDTATELNGRFTAIQGHTFEINESVKMLAVNSSSVLNTLMGIKSDTARLANIESGIGSMKQSLDVLNTKGIAIKQ